MLSFSILVNIKRQQIKINQFWSMYFWPSHSLSLSRLYFSSLNIKVFSFIYSAIAEDCSKLTWYQSGNLDSSHRELSSDGTLVRSFYHFGFDCEGGGRNNIHSFFIREIRGFTTSIFAWGISLLKLWFLWTFHHTCKEQSYLGFAIRRELTSSGF